MYNSPFNAEMLPNFQAIYPSRIEQDTRDLIKKHRENLEKLLSQSAPFTWENLMQPMEEMSDEFSQFWSPIAHLHSVLESESLREAYNKTLPLITEHQTEIAQNEKLFAAVDAIYKSDMFAKLNRAQQKIIENDLRDFKLAGIHLPATKKAKMAELQQTLSQLMTTFSENLLDATNAWTLHIIDEKELAGLPKQALQLAIDNAKQRGLTGYVLTLDYPSYSTAIKYLQRRELRKTIYEAYTTRASDAGPNAGKWDNSRLMEDILKTRHEIANLVGFNNYAEFSLATKMAKTSDEVLHFLSDLAAKSKPFAEKEYAEIVACAKKMDQIDTLEAWDVAYYSEKLQQSTFHFTQEDVRPYFSVHKVLAGLFSLVKKIYGLNIHEETSINVWHPHVKFYSIYDEEDELRGGFYIDLFARPHKRDGAWMDECRTRKQLDQITQHPVAYLTCNFMPPIDNQPALLTHDDVLTLFHEFGHCLHHLLTKVDFPSVAGINGVPWDAVEFPSQLMENFCWEKASLELISGHFQTGELLPDALYQKMKSAKNFQSGLDIIRQLEFAIFDFRLHLEFDPTQSVQVQKKLDDVRKSIAAIQPPAFNRFQHSFSHIFAGNYAAGYYSYKWAEVLSSDAYSQFEEHGVFDRATGDSFMKNVLEVGGVPDPMEAFIAFRGREPTIDALLRLSGITK
ncbi:MAG: hypothetical protein ACD_46C00259G0006 [uncultured bacterium]|nr:MAG: hypothetical protein ACD_46C00259G0006 [uncultured bacterium]